MFGIRIFNHIRDYLKNGYKLTTRKFCHGGFTLIQVSNLTKRYGQHLAVDNINFTVNEGEILGFLGPNGAGKSTTMNMITGYLSSTAGSISIDGFDILEKPEEAKKRIGYLPDLPPIYGDMLVREYLYFVCDIKNVKKDNRKVMVENIMESVKITDMAGRLIKNLSKGYKQRVGLAQAMIGFPPVLVLDEPTVGLDPKQIIEMRDVITNLGRNHTIILSSHILSEVSAVCDRVMIINKGRIVASDTPEKLSEGLSKGGQLILRVKGNKEEIINVIQNIEVVESVKVEAEREPGTVDVIVDGDKSSDVREILFNTLSAHQMPILMMKSVDITLEQIFLQVTQAGGAQHVSHS